MNLSFRQNDINYVSDSPASTPNGYISRYYTPTGSPSLRQPVKKPSYELSASEASEVASVCSRDHPFSEYTAAVDTRIKLDGVASSRTQELSELRVFKYVVLSRWDNIIGPQLVKCWAARLGEEDEKLISYVNLHVLTGDIDEACRSTRDKERKLLFLTEQQIVILAVVFNVVAKHGAKTSDLYCISIVFPYTDPSFAARITSIYTFLYQSLAPIKEIVRVSMGNHFGISRLDEIRGIISKLDPATANMLHYSLNCVRRPLWWGNDTDSVGFLRRVYQGVLSCRGFCVITGRQTDFLRMEQVATMLGHVMTDQDKALTIFPTPHHDTFTSHVFMQTLPYEQTPEEIFNTHFPSRALDANKFPMAIVDVSTREVKVTASLDRHERERQGLRADFSGAVPVERCGRFVEKLVDRICKFRSNDAFLKRFGGVAVTEIICKADLFGKLCGEWSYKDNMIRTMLKWDQWDAEIFIAWACWKDPMLKRMLYGRTS